MGPDSILKVLLFKELVYIDFYYCFIKMESRPIMGQICDFHLKRFTLLIIVKELNLFTRTVMCQRSSL